MPEMLNPTANLTLLTITFGEPTEAGATLVRQLVTAQQGLIFSSQTQEYRAAFFAPAQAFAALLALQETAQARPDLALTVRLAFELGRSTLAEDAEVGWQGRLIENENWLLRLISQHRVPASQYMPQQAGLEVELQALLRGQYKLAVRWLQHNIELAQQAGDSSKQALSLLLAALVRLTEGNIEMARQIAEESLAAARLVQDKGYRRLALLILVKIAGEQNEPEQASQYQEEAGQLERELTAYRQQAALLNSLAKAAYLRSEQAISYGLFEQSLVLARGGGSQLEELIALSNLTDRAFARHDYETGMRLFSDCIELIRRLDDEPAIAVLLCAIGNLLVGLGEDAMAKVVLEETLQFSRLSRHRAIAANTVLGLAELSRQAGDYAAAQQHYQQGLALAWRTVNHFGLAAALVGLARLSLEQDQPDRAQRLLQKAFSISLRTANRPQQAFCLESLARLCQAQGQARRAVWLLGAAHSLRQKIGVPARPADRVTLESLQTGLAAQLGDRLFRQAWTKGISLSAEQAFKSGLGKLNRPTSPRPTPTETIPVTTSSTEPANERLAALSRREVEILNLLAMGFSNAQIAEHLSLSNYTVASYLRALYTKIGVNSRTAAASYALKHRLVTL